MAMFEDPSKFAFIDAFRSRWRLIRQELRELDAPLLTLHRIGPVELYAEALLKNNGWTPSWQVDSTEPNHDWLTYGLSYKGMLPDGMAETMPVTSRLLSRLQGCAVAAFSRMGPRGFIAPHKHPEMEGRLLTMHLGLDVVPRRSYICVDGEMREQREGGVLIFHGAADHFSINMSDSDRTVLYMEFDPCAVCLLD
jgi:aspartyl/asparaginyl beta-hydroxylase (cupin superfamily)